MYTSDNSLADAARRSRLLDEEMTGRKWCNCAVRDTDCLAEKFAVLAWLPDDRADDTASEYDIPLLAAEDGASSDLELDLDT